MSFPSWSASKGYDGIWFLGFNLKSPVFKVLAVRQAVDATVDKDFIAKALVSAEVVPSSLVPPGMLGYDPDVQAEPHDLKYAKLLMKKAGFLTTDKRLKALSLLHTDGIVTVAIAKKVQSDLRQLGIKLDLVPVSYQDEEKWVKELLAGKHDLFLMGYKAGMERLFTSEADVAEVDSAGLLEPLFKTGGDANFTGYSNSAVDKLFAQLAALNPALKEERHRKLKAVNRQLVKDLPVISLFYIETL